MCKHSAPILCLLRLHHPLRWSRESLNCPFSSAVKIKWCYSVFLGQLLLQYMCVYLCHTRSRRIVCWTYSLDVAPVWSFSVSGCGANLCKHVGGNKVSLGRICIVAHDMKYEVIVWHCSCQHTQLNKHRIYYRRSYPDDVLIINTSPALLMVLLTYQTLLCYFNKRYQVR